MLSKRLPSGLCASEISFTFAMSGVFRTMSSVSNKICFGLATPPVKEACAEFLGTFVLVLLGNGVMASCVLGRLDLNSVMAGSFGWGLAVMIGVAIAGGVSGGHINPAVTVALATVRKCSWKRAFPFVMAQYVASFLAAAVLYLIYNDAISKYDGGVRLLPPSSNATAQIFATYPQDFVSIATCVWDQVISTALLLIAICAATDMQNLRVPPHTQPIIIGLSVTAIIIAFGHNCGAPLNPARDFSPRLFTALSGWGMNVFSYRNYEWFWVPILAPHIGGIVGVWLYKVLIELPFKNYGRLLEEIVCNEDGRHPQVGASIQKSSHESVSSDEEGYKRMLEHAQKTIEKEQAVLSQRKPKVDAAENV